jgi:hypothetical protein
MLSLLCTLHFPRPIEKETWHPTASKIGRRWLGTIARALEHPWNKILNLWGDFQCLPEVKAIESSEFMERAMGIEPMSEHGQAAENTS